MSLFWNFISYDVLAVCLGRGVCSVGPFTIEGQVLLCLVGAVGPDLGSPLQGMIPDLFGDYKHHIF